MKNAKNSGEQGKRRPRRTARKTPSAFPWPIVVGTGAACFVLGFSAGWLSRGDGVTPAIDIASPITNLVSKPGWVPYAKHDKAMRGVKNEMNLDVWKAVNDGLSSPKPRWFTVRAWLRKNYSGAFRRSEKTHYSIMVTDEDRTSEWVYAKRDSAEGKKLFSILKDGQLHVVKMKINRMRPDGSLETRSGSLYDKFLVLEVE